MILSEIGLQHWVSEGKRCLHPTEDQGEDLLYIGSELISHFGLNWINHLFNAGQQILVSIATTSSKLTFNINM